MSVVVVGAAKRVTDTELRMSQVGRNAPCPCGSGRKHKRCCLRRDTDAALDAREVERVWDRMQSWALDRFGDQIGGPLKEHMDARGVGTNERPAFDEDLSLALCWLLIDRDVETGGTPAQLYSQLPELSVGERQVAARIAASGLGLHRVRDSEPGAWIELEDLVDGRTVRVSSANVSREAVRWHVLVCRVMQGRPAPSLWGAAGFYEPAEEPELLDELRRIATARDLGAGTPGLRAALRIGAGDLLCFVPPSRRAQPVPHTLEGDSVVVAEASWKLRDPDAALDALCAVPELALDDVDADEAVTFSWLAPRRELLVRRPPLPVGAVCVESGPATLSPDGELEANDLTSLGTFTLRGGRLEFFGLSEARLVRALALIERRLGSLAGRPRSSVRSVDAAITDTATDSLPARDASPARASRRHGSRPSLDASMRRLSYTRWIDDPNERLAGITPREAASRPEQRDEVERQLRSLEHHDARERDDRRPGPDVDWLRAELGLERARVAA
jgi:hypothetical protein